MKSMTLILGLALVLGACASNETQPAKAPEQDAAAKASQEQLAADEAKANEARELAMAQEAQRQAAAKEAAAQKAAADKAAADKAAADKAAADKAKADKAAADKAAADKAAADKAAADKAKAAADKAAADKAAADKAAAAAAATAVAGKTASAKEQNVNPAAPTDMNVVAEMETSAGTMVLGFYPDVAPNHVKNFVDLAKQGFYDGTLFHRVIKGFMIQGGDPNTKDPAKSAMWGAGGPGYKVNAEFNANKHVRGTLSMARASDPNSAGSQFFICHAEASFLDGQYTVFGELLKGYDVLDKIATGAIAPGTKDRPKDPVKILKVTIRARTPADVKQAN